MFPNISKRVRAGAIELISEYFEGVKALSNEMFDSIHKDLAMVLAKRPQKQDNSAEIKQVMDELGRDVALKQKTQDAIEKAIVAY
jgi:hypothetical protein